MKQYLQLLKDIKENGYDHPDRTGVGRRSIFGTNLRFKMSDGFPLVTTRKIFTRGMIEETLWFIRGSKNAQELSDKKVNIWDLWKVEESHIREFADKNLPKISEASKQTLVESEKEVFIKGATEAILGTIGPMYGNLWRNAPATNYIPGMAPMLTEEELPKDKIETYKARYAIYLSGMPEDKLEFVEFANNVYRAESIDQLNELVLSLKKNPHSARHIVTAWVPSEVPYEKLSPQENVIIGKGALAACHAMFQCFVRGPLEEGGKKRLSLLIFIRSNDFPIGAPYNISQYALLLNMLAHVCGYEADELVYNVGDCHIYFNQLPMIDEQLAREPLPLPKLWLNPDVKSLFDFTIDDIKIEGYESRPEIKYPVAK